MKNRGKSPVSDHHKSSIKDTRGSSSGRSLAGSGTSCEQDAPDVIHPQQVSTKYLYVHLNLFLDADKF